jgi:hypothetical protein
MEVEGVGGIKGAKIARFYGSIFMILAGLLFKLLNIYSLAVGLVLGGVVLFTSNLYQARKLKTENSVKKIRRINERAGYYAFWITLFLLSASFFMQFFKPLRIGLRKTYEIVLLGGVYSWIFLRLYFSKKG